MLMLILLQVHKIILRDPWWINSMLGDTQSRQSWLPVNLYCYFVWKKIVNMLLLMLLQVQATDIVAKVEISWTFYKQVLRALLCNFLLLPGSGCNLGMYYHSLMKSISLRKKKISWTYNSNYFVWSVQKLVRESLSATI